jgi:hypothetical protein
VEATEAFKDMLGQPAETEAAPAAAKPKRRRAAKKTKAE